ncbi:MAG: hypothetical protein A2542_03170 [Parcubacteria group bacterium RIFOXYD2_FULL_52_8]|nr:MAG: hypothetical protein A2542_03170 [Parcubacteria group bacterium RIFOXYD2_FULL_52_8]
MDDILKRIYERHHGNTSGFSRHYLLLYTLVLGLEAKKVLEFGSGFSSIVILEALRHTGGRLISTDMRPVSNTGMSPEEIAEHPEWTYLEGNSLTTIPVLKETGFDLVLHDGSHEWRVVLRDLKRIIPRMKQDGLILVHDTHHRGKNFHLLLATQFALLGVRHEKVTLPYGYGLTITRIKGDRGHGRVSTTWEKAK